VCKNTIAVGIVADFAVRCLAKGILGNESSHIFGAEKDTLMQLHSVCALSQYLRNILSAIPFSFDFSEARERRCHREERLEGDSRCKKRRSHSTRLDMLRPTRNPTVL